MLKTSHKVNVNTRLSSKTQSSHRESHVNILVYFMLRNLMVGRFYPCTQLHPGWGQASFIYIFIIYLLVFPYLYNKQNYNKNKNNIHVHDYRQGDRNSVSQLLRARFVCLILIKYIYIRAIDHTEKIWFIVLKIL